MFNLFKMALAFAVAAAVAYFLFRVLEIVVDYAMAFVGIATGIVLVFEWVLISFFQIFIPLYVAGLIFAFIYEKIVR